MKQIVKKVKEVLFKLLLVFFLFPASVCVFPSFKEWFAALVRGKYFFKIVMETAPGLVSQVQERNAFYRLAIGLPLRISVKLMKLGNFEVLFAYIKQHKVVRKHLVVQARPVELIPGLVQGRPEAVQRARQLLGILPTATTHIGQYVRSLFGENQSFAGRRVVVIAHWDPDNCIDPYVQHLARHFKENGRKVIIASAAKPVGITAEGNEDWVDAIVYRSCSGYDFTSWKAALEIFPSLYDAEEVILTNDSFFGPLGSFFSVHEKMKAVVCDFWGLVNSNQFHPHLQSYYLVFSKSVLSHACFKEFFARVPLSNNRDEAIACELSLAMWLSLHGLQAAAFFAAPAENVVNSTNEYWRKLIAEGLPLIKRELIINPLLTQLSTGWPAVCAQSGYPVEMIVRYLRRSALAPFAAAPLVGDEPNSEENFVLRKALATLEQGTPSSCATVPPVTVLIPVYNGIDHLRTLLPSLLKNLNPSTHLLFIDDASPDPEVVKFLEEQLKSCSNAQLIRNEQNLGFTNTVNRGMAMVQTPYAVLLNTDVIVPENWLSRMLAPFEKAPGSIASITPFTNAGVFFSFPRWCEDNTLLPAFTVEELDAAFAQLQADVHEGCEIHSGVGFCMAINMACWEAIGPLDAEAFGRGYGEECDWCMRAISKGWRNVLVPNLFVYHAHGGSFKPEEKELLCKEHQAILQQRWPKAIESIAQHVQNNPWMPYRAMASLLLSQGGKGCILVVDLDHALGGAIAHREKKIANILAEGWRVLLLKYDPDDAMWKLSCRYMDEKAPIRLRGLYEMAFVFETLSIQKVIINNFAFYPRVKELLSFFIHIQKQYNLSMEYLLHDFYCICPSFFLLDAQTKFCKAGDAERCLTCLPQNHNRIIHESDAALWRKDWHELLAVCDTLLCFSDSTKNIFTSVYGMEEKVVVCEHEPLDDVEKKAFVRPQKQAELNIAFLGGMYVPKGKLILKSLADLFDQHNLNAKIHLFWKGGEFTPHKNFVNHGPYGRSELVSLLQANDIAAVVFPSIWPESFSYVVQESMLMGIPLVCFDIGAPAERLRKYQYTQCEIVSEISAKAMYEGLEKLLQREYGWTYAEFPRAKCKLCKVRG